MFKDAEVGVLLSTSSDFTVPGSSVSSLVEGRETGTASATVLSHVRHCHSVCVSVSVAVAVVSVSSSAAASASASVPASLTV